MSEPRRFRMLRSYTVADYFTLSNAAFGMASVFICLNYVAAGSQKEVLWPGFLLLFLAAVCDLLDGFVARKLNSSSFLGEDLDSLADVISFVVAPATLDYTLGMRGLWDALILVYFVLCGVSRLARFNATTDDLKGEDGKVAYFEGTPIPTSLGLVIILFIAFVMGDTGNQLWLSDFELFGKTMHPLVLMFFLSGSAMISSNLRIPKP